MDYGAQKLITHKITTDAQQNENIWSNWFSVLPELPYIKLLQYGEQTQTAKLLKVYWICGSLSCSKAVHHWFLCTLPKSFSKALRQNYLEVNVLKAHRHGILARQKFILSQALLWKLSQCTIFTQHVKKQ